MATVTYRLISWIAAALFSTQALAGAQTSSIVINGPGIPRTGVVITNPDILQMGGWFGKFIDGSKGDKAFAPTPSPDLPRYILSFYIYGTYYDKNGKLLALPADYVRQDAELALNVLYVWDDRSDRALIYLPAPSDLGYRVNFSYSKEEREGKWFYAVDPWARAIRKALPQN